MPSYPILMSEEHCAVLGYRIADSDLGWCPQGIEANLGGSGKPSAILQITSPYYIVWTPYCQQGLGQHPLAKAGLRWFSVFEVANSPLFEPHPVWKRRHLVFQFEDSTLDIVCECIEATRFAGSVKEMAAKVSELFARKIH